MTYQRNNASESADRPATEIADEMISAGLAARALFTFDNEPEVMVYAIYSAMELARQNAKL